MHGRSIMTAIDTSTDASARMEPAVFRRWFHISMILLGIYLAGSALLRIHG